MQSTLRVLVWTDCSTGELQQSKDVVSIVVA